MKQLAVHGVPTLLLKKLIARRIVEVEDRWGHGKSTELVKPSFIFPFVLSMFHFSLL